MQTQMVGTKQSCLCEKCKGYCEHKPGWFLPSEAERVAFYLNVTLEELFNTKLGVDWWEAEENIFLLSPATKTGIPGHEFPGNPRGEYIFFQNGLCTIHAVKPYECRESFHAESNNGMHERVANAWNTPESQQQIKDFLRHKPRARRY